MKYVINPKYRFLEEFIFSVPRNFTSTGELIYSGRNILKRYKVQGCSLVVKSFKIPNLINRFVYMGIRKSKARRSFEYANYLLEQNIYTPEPVAFIEDYFLGLNHSFYISLECPFKRNLREFWYVPEIGERMPILEAFARYTANIHDKGILHKDYSAGNILFGFDHGYPSFALVDINRMKFGIIGEEEGYKNLDHLWLPDDTYKVIAYNYALARGFDPQYAIKRVCYFKDKQMGNL
ncbi:tyrosine protein kinase [uncultured Parabacteroides sp.]|uniref:tyrosine protein kinase n=1 Tax=uncultured Parabacteroides sp. TaxID=512312 RepID=UPI0026027B7E|nr:tyrosine protein kinase [uncultured Parabacteroides sp.]